MLSMGSAFPEQPCDFILTLSYPPYGSGLTISGTRTPNFERLSTICCISSSSRTWNGCPSRGCSSDSFSCTTCSASAPCETSPPANPAVIISVFATNIYLLGRTALHIIIFLPKGIEFFLHRFSTSFTVFCFSIPIYFRLSLPAIWTGVHISSTLL